MGSSCNCGTDSIHYNYYRALNVCQVDNNLSFSQILYTGNVITHLCVCMHTEGDSTIRSILVCKLFKSYSVKLSLCSVDTLHGTK